MSNHTSNQIPDKSGASTARTVNLKLDVKHAIRSKYAWPGGYPLFLLMADCEALCVGCGRANYSLIARAKRDHDTQWQVVAVDINWEDESLYCAHCSKPIESAYGEESA